MRPSILFVTDLAYPAQGRRYGDEDVFLTSRLREDFDLALCHPRDAAALMDRFDAVVVRNSGPVLAYREAYQAFRAAALAGGVRVYNPLTGRGDMAGKRYLVELTAAGEPVIPTVDRLATSTGCADRRVRGQAGRRRGLRRPAVRRARPARRGGRRTVTDPAAGALPVRGVLLLRRRRLPVRPARPRPAAALGAGAVRAHRGGPGLRPPLRALEHPGPRRAAGGRLPHVDGALLLVELEDLNPYLSLDLVAAEVREGFVAALGTSLRRFLAAG
ncbi:hypothetical protein [Micromonospora sp. 4G55]|uniref:hypothetical protein n=1 Tax=Micromonospora sp. 4G55 TaxID=2806102 RepID=UPI001A4AF84B|nr:hypothetical protein [Micromonospora sp. 4G55]MBM0257871.1 hypothetical protein [Micromonospora sp. 4G55]